jgi:sec-independent protein translocase protein TatC
MSLECLKAFRKYFIVVSFVVAAVLTPPDAISQIAMALPLLLLYEVGLWGAWLYRKRSSLR